MQAKTYLHGSVVLSTTCKGKPRKLPVWELRYRLPSGKDSRKILGNAWTKTSRPPAGFLTRTQADHKAQAFFEEHAADTPDARRTFKRACEAFFDYCEQERGLRGSTMHEYRRIATKLGVRQWRKEGTWDERLIDNFTSADLLAVRAELVKASRSPETINHYRRVIRGVFGTGQSSSALGWKFMAVKPETAGKLRFYTPDQVARLREAATLEQDRDIYTLATEAGPRQSEIRDLRVKACDFAADRLRIEGAYTTRGGRAGTKSHKIRSIPMSTNVRRMLLARCQDKQPDDLVFEHHEDPGEPMDGMTMHRHFKADLATAALPEIRFHDLRHSFGTQAARRFPIHVVQEWMGHADISTTMRYLHYVEDPEASAKLTDLWVPDSPQTPAPAIAAEPTEPVANSDVDGPVASVIDIRTRRRRAA